MIEFLYRLLSTADHAPWCVALIIALTVFYLCTRLARIVVGWMRGGKGEVPQFKANHIERA